MSVKITDLESLLVHEIKDLYSAEKQLVSALPKMAKAAQDKQLKAAFQAHLEETHEHVRRLEDISEQLGVKPTGQKCAGMEGLVEEGSDMVSEDAPPDVKDAGLIAAAQRVEHYEIAGYGTARAFAQRLGMTDIARLLEETLEEEKAADVKLTEVAMAGVNADAMNG